MTAPDTPDGATMPVHDELRVDKGTVIFRQGELGDEMFVIAAGHVRLTLEGTVHARAIALLGPGDFFGELSMVNGGIRTATAEAIEDTALLVIGRDAFAMLVQDDLQIVAHMMSTQSRRLMETNRPVESLGQHLGRIRVVACCLREIGVPPRLPWSAEVSRLAVELHLAPSAVTAIVGELVVAGAGTLTDAVWALDQPAHVERALETLCRWAAEQASA